MHVLFISGREIDYSRNAVLLRAFERFASVDVISADATKPIYYLRNFVIALQALLALRRQHYDLVFIGFYGHIILRLLSPFIRQPLLFDAFISNYDTLCFDRNLFEPDSILGRATFWLDQANGKRATHLLLDTTEHAEYFVDTFDLNSEKISVLPVGCRDDIFTPDILSPQIPNQPQNGLSHAAADKSRTRVLYYCTYLPLHGVETILNAAKMLETEPIDLYLIGDGPLFQQMTKRARQLALQNLTFQPPMPITDLAVEIVRADICLGGHFGESGKAGRVIPGKIYQILAMGRPTIATNTPANSRFLCHGTNALLIPSNDAPSLSNAIKRLHCDGTLRRKIANGGRQLYMMEASEQVIAERLHKIVIELVRRDIDHP